MSVFFTADLHFGHRRILEHVPSRPWLDVEAMNVGLVERWNATVRPGDTVYVLGDMALSPSKLGPVAGLNGRKVLIAGNHDSCWSGHKRWSGQMHRYYDAGFAEVHETGLVSDFRLWDERGSWTVHLAHLPYTGDSHDVDRYVDHRPVDDGTVLLCGHVHDAWKVKRTPRGTVQINVGVDVRGWAPVSEETLCAELDELLTGNPG